MTFNLKFASPDGPHSWPERRPVVRALLGRERPDVIGTQEGLAGQLADIVSDLGGAYRYLGSGRDGGANGEHTAILYAVDRLTPVADGVSWLSDTPDVAGSNTWGARCVRMVTWACFRDAVTGREFGVVNTHLDHISERARQRSTALIRDRIAAFDGRPAVLTGDFNTPAGAGSPTYRLLTDDAGLVDAWTAAPTHGPQYGTWHDYGPVVEGGPRIDWILVTPGIKVEAVAADPFTDGGRYPSDHLPVQARVGLPVQE